MYQKLLSFLFLSFISLSCTTPERINKNLNELFQHCYQNNLFNGHVLVYRKGEIIYNTSFGNLSYDNSTPITDATPFRLASLSKQFTAIGIVYLKAQGLLNYEDRVVQYCPDFPYQAITIRQLLNQTSGLPKYQDLINGQYEKLEARFKEQKIPVNNTTIENILTTHKPDLEFEPETNFNYSNTNYLYLAQIIEKVSGKSFQEFLKEQFFDPIEMSNSWVADTMTIHPQKAIGYKQNRIENTYEKNEVPPFLQTYGDGGIYSSAQDLLTWFQALDAGKIMDNKELEQAYLAPKIAGEDAPYGFGWFLRSLPFNGHKALTHSGEFAGFSNAIFRDLDANTTVIMLSNNSHKVRSEINSAVIRILYGVPYDLPKITAETVLSDMVLSGKIKAAKEFFTTNAKNKIYDFSEKAFNKFGYNLLAAKKQKAAIEVFQWNVELNPNSSNVYDSLGEAYLANEDKENALKYYSIAYKMDSKNKNAKQIIDQLSSQ